MDGVFANVASLLTGISLLPQFIHNGIIPMTASVEPVSYTHLFGRKEQGTVTEEKELFYTVDQLDQEGRHLQFPGKIQVPNADRQEGIEAKRSDKGAERLGAYYEKLYEAGYGDIARKMIFEVGERLEPLLFEYEKLTEFADVLFAAANGKQMCIRDRGCYQPVKR